MSYNFTADLGKGVFGEVKKAEKEGKSIAVKILNIESPAYKKLALKEVQLLKEISSPKCHPSLACFYDYQIVGDKLYLEMEFIEGETLNLFAKRYRGDEQNLYKYLIAIIADISSGLKYMHSRGVIHRDIKPENIIINTKNNPKLIDIGLACSTLKDNKPILCNVDKRNINCCSGAVGTPLYSAPELLLFKISYFSSDMFSLGASIYNAAIDKFLYELDSNATMNDLLYAIRYSPLPKLETNNSELNYLVNRMLVFEPLDRITEEEILERFEIKYVKTRDINSKIKNFY